MNVWYLPKTATIGGVQYTINTDYRDVREIIDYLSDESKPMYIRWQIALALFYDGDIPQEHQQEAVEWLAEFIRYDSEQDSSGPKLIDWEQDAQIIVGDINATQSADIRSVEYMHWWTFLDKFNDIGEGRLATIVSIRDKLKHGKKLEKWEKEYYQKNKKRIDLKKRYTAEEQAEIDLIKKFLGGG